MTGNGAKIPSKIDFFSFSPFFAENLNLGNNKYSVRKITMRSTRNLEKNVKLFCVHFRFIEQLAKYW